MSQVVFITGPGAGGVRAALSRTLALYRDIAGLAPARVVDHGRYALAIFDSVARPGGARLAENELGLVAGVGAWFGDGRAQGDLLPLVRAASQDDAALIARMDAYDGCFAFLVVAGECLTVITDPLGRLHLYQAEWGDVRLVCTSSLILAALIQPPWQMPAVREFLALGYVLDDHSLFRGIDKCRPGSIIRLPFERSWPAVRQPYWRVADWMAADRAGAGVAPLAEALETAVDQVYKAFARPALDLTGGFDSRALLGAALRRVPAARIQTVVSGTPASPDVGTARHIAEHFGLPWLRQDARPADAGRWWTLARQALPLVDGEYDVFEYASILAIHSALAARFDASINGSGGELCRGYWWELLLPFIGWHGHFDARRIAAARFATDPWAEDLLAASFDTTLAEQVAGMIDIADADVSAGLNTARMDNVYLMVRMQRWQGRLASATGRLWPCFSPFLMKAPMQAALGAGVWPRVGNRMARRLISHLDPALAELPMASGLPAAPPSWHNAWRFRGAPPALARRVAGKAARSVRRPAPAGAPASDAPVGFADRAFWDWWSEPRTAALYKPGRLPDVHDEAAPGPIFGHPARLGRMATLELVARTLDSNRR